METTSRGLVLGLDEQVNRWHLLQHPFYQDWQAGRLERSALQLYAAQYYRHVEAFPRHLRTLAARTDGKLRKLIEENLAEEENPRQPHPKLWRDFAAAVDVSNDELDSAESLPGTRALVETYRNVCAERSVAEAVAALYVYEAQIPVVATAKIDGLKRHYGIGDERTLAFFTTHERADVYHAKTGAELIERLAADDEGRADVIAAADEALAALWGMLDRVQSHPSVAA